MHCLLLFSPLLIVLLLCLLSSTEASCIGKKKPKDGSRVGVKRKKNGNKTIHFGAESPRPDAQHEDTHFTSATDTGSSPRVDHLVNGGGVNVPPPPQSPPPSQ